MFVGNQIYFHVIDIILTSEVLMVLQSKMTQGVGLCRIKTKVKSSIKMYGKMLFQEMMFIFLISF